MRRAPATSGVRRDDPLGFVIAAVGNAAASAFEAALAPTGLHPRHFAVLKGLQSGEARSQRELAASLGIPTSRLVGLLDVLVERGFVERQDSGTDRRVKLVRLLAAGRAELEKLIVLAGESEQRVTAGLSAADRAELRRLLGIVYANTAAGPEETPARVW